MFMYINVCIYLCIYMYINVLICICVINVYLIHQKLLGKVGVRSASAVGPDGPDELELRYSNCNTLQHNSTHCNTLQHIATHCNNLQHTALRKPSMN